VDVISPRLFLPPIYYNHSRASCNRRRPYYDYCFYEAKLCLRKMIPLLFFSRNTLLHKAAGWGHLEICRLLLQCNSDVEAKDQ
jgi:hypothetical protein